MDADQPIDARRKQARLWVGGGLLLALAIACAVTAALAQQQPAAPAAAAGATAAPGPKILVKLVTDFESGRLVSDVETFEPVTSTVFGEGGSSTTILGEKCVLWVRNVRTSTRSSSSNATIKTNTSAASRTWRSTRSSWAPASTARARQPQVHTGRRWRAQVGRSRHPHRRAHRLPAVAQGHVHGVDAAKTGPVDFRLVPADLGLLSMDAALKLDPPSCPIRRTCSIRSSRATATRPRRR